ncbi:DUF4197 domain-containing protein [Cytophagaceae bacterium ABcell3]|nr:DUF4197 domain-containing protein [Cytophagaceae bacterium ABcell3]
MPFPPDAQRVESTLRKAGLDKQVDDVVLSLNQAAEDAAAEAKPIFMEAIKGLSIQDAVKLIKGEDDAATQYLERNTTNSLSEKFKPVISASLEKVNATKHWETAITRYNKIPMTKKVDADLENYVTEKAIAGLFTMVAKEELAIRKDPAARTSDLLKKAFK